MIYTHIPYAPKEDGANLGMAYNMFMEKLDPGDWVCFLDHDAMFTTADWYRHLEELIDKYPDAGIITGMTNRIGNLPQKLKITNCDIEHTHDMKIHRMVGKTLYEMNGLNVRDVTTLGGWLISGIMMLIKKQTWLDIGGCCDGFLAVDNDIHKRVRDIGKKVYIADGIYLYHWYREEL